MKRIVTLPFPKSEDFQISFSGDFKASYLLVSVSIGDEVCDVHLVNADSSVLSLSLSFVVR